jgi:hypothetical protein
MSPFKVEACGPFGTCRLNSFTVGIYAPDYLFLALHSFEPCFVIPSSITPLDLADTDRKLALRPIRVANVPGKGNGRTPGQIISECYCMQSPSLVNHLK